MLLKDARIGDLVFDRADGRAVGHPAPERHLHARAHPDPYTDWKQVRTFPYGTIVYDLDVSPDGTLPGRPRSARSAASRTCGCSPSTRLGAGDAHARWPTFDFGPVGPVELRVLAGRPLPLRQLLLHRRRRTSSATSSRPGSWTRSRNAETGFFRPIPLGGDDLIVFRYTGEGFVPARIDATPLEDVSAITFLGRAGGREAPAVVKDVEASARRPAIPFDSMPKRERPVPARRRPRPRVGLPDRPGLQGHRGRRPPREPLRPAAVQPAQPVGDLLARRRPAGRRALHLEGRATSATTGGPAPS